MAKDLVVPTLGESVTEATVSKWLKQVGDPVKADEPVVELETDELAEAMRSIYNNKIINQQEQSPIELREGRLILKTTITRIESIKSTGLTYGFLVEETMFKCVPHENAKSKLKIKGGESEKK